jgi:hypothetical protein
MAASLNSTTQLGESAIFPPDLQTLLQSILIEIANIDFAYESDVEVVQNSTTDEVLKKQVVLNLHQHHRERREPYLVQLATLQDRIRKVAA